MKKTFLRIGALVAMFAVIIGAFGAHGLRETLSSENLATFEIGVRYQFYHAFAILIVGLLMYNRKNKLLIAAGWLFLGGVVLFSGSLYLLAVRETMNLALHWLGPITPIGGLLFIAGWACLIISTYQENQRRKITNESA